VLELLHQAENPLIVAGDGLFWSQGQVELTRFAEMTLTPVYGRRAGRGALDEAHVLSVKGAWSKPLTADADLVLTFGFRFWSGEGFGEPPKWAERATYVRIDAAADRAWSNGPADLTILGDPKAVLQQMIDKAREMGLDFSFRKESRWMRRIRDARQRFETSLLRRAGRNASARPIHPDRIMRDMLSVMDADATLIKDSFTLSGYVDHWFTPHTTGQVVDAGPLAPVGAGVGMGMGAQLGRPGKQVIVASGDGGIGIGGMDLETAVRHRIPIVVVLFNNSSWGPDPAVTFEMEELRSDFEMISDIRYDRVFEPMGVHAEHVEEAEELVPAFERALESGKPALIHIVSSNRYGNPALGTDFFSQDRFGKAEKP
jgi:acetolactate synthase-1/2/3 large subunit